MVCDRSEAALLCWHAPMSALGELLCLLLHMCQFCFLATTPCLCVFAGRAQPTPLAHQGGGRRLAQPRTAALTAQRTVC